MEAENKQGGTKKEHFITGWRLKTNLASDSLCKTWCFRMRRINLTLIFRCYLCISWLRGCAWAWCRSRRPRRSSARWCGTRSPSWAGLVAVRSRRCARCTKDYLEWRILLARTANYNTLNFILHNVPHQNSMLLYAIFFTSIQLMSRLIE